MSTEQYDIRWKDYYEIMQVHPRADPDVIAAAYRKLAQKYHPDHSHNPKDSDRIKDINEAYEVLSDPERRASYNTQYQKKQTGRSRDEHDHSEDRKEGPEEETSYKDWERRDEYYERYYSDKDDEEYYEEPTQDEETLYGIPFLGPVSRLVNFFSPYPDERQRLLPWPSWAWQRMFLWSSVTAGVFLVIAAGSAGAWGFFILMFLFLIFLVWAFIATGWMRSTRRAPLAARIAGGTGIVVGGLSWAFAVLYVLLLVAALVAAFFFMFVFLKATLEWASKR